MNTVNRVSTFVASAVTSLLVINTTANAGPGCNYATQQATGYPSSLQAAIYQTAPDGYQQARAYRMGMGYGNDHSVKTKNSGQGDIVDTAVAAGSFQTLVAAVKAADLVDTLKGQGPFTVFAPTDDAFAKIPKDQLNALLRDKAALTKVLTYHVVPGKVDAATVVSMDSASTVEGQSLQIKVGDGVMVNNAKVIKTDIATSNGIIHVIDTVLLPPDLVSQR